MDFLLQDKAERIGSIDPNRGRVKFGRIPEAAKTVNGSAMLSERRCNRFAFRIFFIWDEKV